EATERLRREVGASREASAEHSARALADYAHADRCAVEPGAFSHEPREHRVSVEVVYRPRHRLVAAPETDGNRAERHAPEVVQAAVKGIDDPAPVSRGRSGDRTPLLGQHVDVRAVAKNAEDDVFGAAVGIELHIALRLRRYSDGPAVAQKRARRACAILRELEQC